MSCFRGCLVLILLALVALSMAKEMQRSQSRRGESGLYSSKPHPGYVAPPESRYTPGRSTRHSAALKLLEAQGETLVEGRTDRGQTKAISGASKVASLHLYREVTAGQDRTFTLNSTSTNATLAEWLCGTVDSSVKTISIYGVESMGLTVPSCLRTKATGLLSLFTYDMNIDNFDSLPETLLSFNWQRGSFIPDPEAAVGTTGFDINEEVVWSFVWSKIPNIEVFVVYTAHLIGLVPTPLPPTLNQLIINGCKLYGGIPAGMLINHPAPTSISDFKLLLPNNNLNGTLADDLFSGFAVANYYSIFIDFSHNTLTGSIPQNWLYSLQNVNLSAWFQLDLSHNRLNRLPSETSFFPKDLVASTGVLSVDISNNPFGGVLPALFFGNISTFVGFRFTAEKCEFEGNLPARLFSGNWQVGEYNYADEDSFYVNLANNKLNGPIPDKFIVGGLSKNATFRYFTLCLNYNQLEGTIPDGLLYLTSLSQSLEPGDARREVEFAFGKVGSTIGRDEESAHAQPALGPDILLEGSSVISIGTVSGVDIEFTGNLLTGQLPSNLFRFVGPSYPNSFTFAVDHNPITGSIPESLFQPIPPGSGAIYLFLLSFTNLTGPLPSYCWPYGLVSWSMSNTLVTGPIPLAWQECKWQAIDLSSNAALVSSIPPKLLSNSIISAFFASNTPLNGTLPAVSSALTKLHLANTSIDFCSTSADTVSIAGTCSISESNVCNCAYHYPSCGTGCVPMDTPVSLPPTTTSLPTSSLPVSSSSSPCSKKSRPSPDFICVNGTWTANSTNTTTLTVPSGAGTIVVNGNLTSTTVVIQGVGSTINITGSITNLTTITVELTPAEVEALSGSKTLQILINTNNGNGSTSNGIQLGQVNVNSRVTSGCKKVKAEKVVLNEGQTLGAYLSVDSSGCNRWWIILVSVVVAVIVLLIIVLVLLAVFCKPFREKVRPYSRARRPAAPST